MRALVLESPQTGRLPVLQDRPVPQPGPGEVLVRVKAAALNHLDLLFVQEMPSWGLPAPLIMGADAAGLVAGLGEGVTNLAEGDRVVLYSNRTCGRCKYCLRGEQHRCLDLQVYGWQRDGLLADYAVVPAENLFPIPEHLSWEEAASLPVALNTAWKALVVDGRYRPGETVLIHGIGSGVALFALQVAVGLGARVIVTSSSDEKLARAQQLGAWAGINYHTTDVAKRVRELTGGEGVDIVLDGVGKATLPTSFKVLARGGRVMGYGMTSGLGEMSMGLLFQGSFIATGAGGPSVFADSLRFVRNTGLRPVISHVHALEEFEAAFASLRAPENFGKVVLRMEQEV